MSLYCLVYTSVSSHKMSEDDLRELLIKLRARNEMFNITGMLLYLDPFFIQILEGEEAIVTELFDKIKHDSRHNKISLIYKKPIIDRSFSNWTMGFNKVSDENIKKLDGFTDFWQRPTSELFSDSPKEIEKLLNSFRDETLF